MERIDRIKKLREILGDIESKCEKCIQIGAWYCNKECFIPGLKIIAEQMLINDGAYVEKHKSEG